MADLPGEPRSVAYLYVLPAFVVYAAFLLFPIGRAVQLSLYDWDGLSRRHVGGARQLRGGLHRRGAARRLRPRPGAGRRSTRWCRWSSGWCWPRYSTTPRCAGSGSSARWCSCRRWSRWSWWPSPGGGCTPPTARSTACSARSGSTRSPGAGWATTPSRCRRSAWSAPGSRPGWCMVLLLAGMQQHPDGAVRGGAARRRRGGPGVLRGHAALGARRDRGRADADRSIAALRTFDLVYVTTQGGPGNARRCRRTRSTTGPSGQPDRLGGGRRRHADRR